MDIKDKQALYKQVLGTPSGQELLADLNFFCYGTRGMIDGPIDAMELARREGRREVFMQIMSLLKVNHNGMFDEYVEDPEF